MRRAFVIAAVLLLALPALAWGWHTVYRASAGLRPEELVIFHSPQVHTRWLIKVHEQKTGKRDSRIGRSGDQTVRLKVAGVAVRARRQASGRVRISATNHAGHGRSIRVAVKE